MAANELLSQEEIDALLSGVAEGQWKRVKSGDRFDDGGVQDYDIVRERMAGRPLPGLDRVDERFAHHLEATLRQMLRCAPEVLGRDAEMMAFSEYALRLSGSASLHVAAVSPLGGKALIAVSGELVFALVDHYFGGDGRFQGRVEGREFSLSETRVVRKLLHRLLADLHTAWAPVAELEFQWQESAANPRLADFVGATEVIITSRFHIQLERGGGDLDITLPLATLEAVRDKLDPNTRNGPVKEDESWNRALREGTMAAKVEVEGSLAQVQLTLRDILHLQTGDMIPFETPGMVTLHIEQIPVIRGRLVESGQTVAVHLVEDASTGR